MLAILGFPLLLVGLGYVFQAMLSSLNGSTSAEVVADHLRFGVLALLFGGVLCGPLFISLRKSKRS